MCNACRCLVIVDTKEFMNTEFNKFDAANKLYVQTYHIYAISINNIVTWQSMQMYIFIREK